jgi:two-component system CheB/CheR fusion protein
MRSLRSSEGARAGLDPRGPLEEILERVRAASGIRLETFRPEFLLPALQRRMRADGTTTLGELLRRLRRSPDEAVRLGEDLLDKTTRFFRNPEVLEALRRRVLDPLVRRRKRPLRIWVAGCSTGEEAYSLGICLLEALERADRCLPVRIVATDVSAEALGVARAGIYPAWVRNHVGRERLERFFLPRLGAYEVVQPLRALCLFARHDVAREFPFRRLDLISCRNVLVYLDPAVRDRVLERFHGALRPGGRLLLGKGEGCAGRSPFFRTIDAEHRIYGRVGPAKGSA